MTWQVRITGLLNVPDDVLAPEDVCAELARLIEDELGGVGVTVGTIGIAPVAATMSYLDEFDFVILWACLGPGHRGCWSVQHVGTADVRAEAGRCGPSCTCWRHRIVRWCDEHGDDWSRWPPSPNRPGDRTGGRG